MRPRIEDSIGGKFMYLFNCTTLVQSQDPVAKEFFWFSIDDASLQMLLMN